MEERVKSNGVKLLIAIGRCWICRPVKIEGPVGGSGDNNLVLEAENNMELGPVRVHKLRCLRGQRCLWEHFLTSKICAVAGSR